jgi:hypothetical protein
MAQTDLLRCSGIFINAGKETSLTGPMPLVSPGLSLPAAAWGMPPHRRVATASIEALLRRNPAFDFYRKSML